MNGNHLYPITLFILKTSVEITSDVKKVFAKTQKLIWKLHFLHKHN